MPRIINADPFSAERASPPFKRGDEVTCTYTGYKRGTRFVVDECAFDPMYSSWWRVEYRFKTSARVDAVRIHHGPLDSLYFHKVRS